MSMPYQERIIPDHIAPAPIGKKHYWITPPELYNKLDAEFHFDFDPCPYPKPKWDGLEVEWGKSNYVNPPYRKIDGSPTAFVRKAIEENKKGKTVVLVLPVMNVLNLLLKANAEMRPLNRVSWLATEDLTPSKSPPHVTCFILRGNAESKDREAIE